MREPLVYLRNFGCQQNISDGERLMGVLQGMGYVSTDSLEAADLIIYNTCAVRENAEKKVFSLIGELKILKAQRPDTLIALCGCMAQQPQISERIKKSYPFVDLVFGTFALSKVPELIHRALEEKNLVVEIEESADYEEIIPAEGARNGEITARVPIMNGCNNFCTYCIVPYVRGRERSRKPEDIVSEVKELVAGGYKDILLLGQNVNSYCGNSESEDFPWLLGEIDRLDGDFRLRFMTSHPKDASDGLIDRLMNSKHLAHHLHLPIQSGSNRILGLMNRRYTAEDYMAIVEKLRGKDPDFPITTDIIVGFPGEEEADFQQTLELCERVGFESMFTFIYSRRTGTKAASMPDTTSHKEKTERMTRLLTLQRRITAEKSRRQLGKVLKVLVEEPKPNGIWTGHSSEGWLVHAQGPEGILGELVDVMITKTTLTALYGHVETGLLQ